MVAWLCPRGREGSRPRPRQNRSDGGRASLGLVRSESCPRTRALVSALVSNHVMDLISKYKPEELPASLISFVKNRGKYDYLHHCEVGSDNADFVTDEIVDRFCLVGPIEQHRKKLEALRKVGVTQFNIYLMCGDEEQTLHIYAQEILPHYKAVTKSTLSGAATMRFDTVIQNGT